MSKKLLIILPDTRAPVLSFPWIKAAFPIGLWTSRRRHGLDQPASLSESGEAEEKIEELCKRSFIKDPQLSIFVEEQICQRITMVGHFIKPGT